MSINFDQEITRTLTNCTKWDFRLEGDQFVFGDHSHGERGDDRLLPLWVADMDFPSPPQVTEALVKRAQHGIFGYCMPSDSYFQAVTEWMARHYGRTVPREWLVLTAGVVPAISMMIETFVKPGDKVLLQQPVYYPFFDSIKRNGAEIVSNSLQLVNGRYEMDFADLAAKAADPAVTTAILCSPHNPVGRVWSADELRQFGEMCLANNVLVVSDEIHCDLIYDDVTFTSFATLGEDFEQRSLVCTAPSKTFNLAGLRTSNIVIPDPDLRAAFSATLERHGLGGSNIFGLEAAEAAYRYGEPWLANVMAYVQDNYRFMASYFAEHLPQIMPLQPEGTYLVWVDFRALGLEPAARKDLLMNEAKVWLDEGEMFGPEGEGFERFNIACPRPLLKEALERIYRAVQTLNTGAD
jgi:cystathionine beta-lyase